MRIIVVAIVVNQTLPLRQNQLEIALSSKRALDEITAR